MDDPTEFVVHQRTSVDAYQRLGRRPDVIRDQVAAVGERGVDQAVNRNRRVRCDLDKAVEGEGEAVVQFIREILKEPGVVDCNVQSEVRTVDASSFRLLPSLAERAVRCRTEGTLSSVHFLDRRAY